MSLYDVLHVERQAPPDAIHDAYRALARVYHPDRPTGSHARMVAINAAWSVLRDPVRRRAYDASLPSAPGRVQAAPARWSGPIASRRRAREATGAALPFGRYAGQTIADIAAIDPDYLRWLARQSVGRAWVTQIGEALGARGGGA